MTHSRFSGCTSAIALLEDNVGELAGDFDLSYVEFVKPLSKKEYTIRLAAVHLHIASRSRTITLKEQLLERMLELEYSLDLERSLYLAPLDWLFVDLPDFMKTKELGYVEVVREKEPDLCVVRVSPVTLHLAGPFSTMRIQVPFEDEVFYRLLLIREVPKKPHICRQQEMRYGDVDDEGL